MRLFILTDTQFAIPSALIYQKTLDLVEAGLQLDQVHFYIVGDAISANYISLYNSHANYNEYAKVEILSTQEAQKRLTSLTNVVIVHFGSSLKNADRFSHYFIPLGHPICNSYLSLLQNWLQKRTVDSYIKKSTNTICLNEWALDTIKLVHPKFSHKILLGYLPAAKLPKFEWNELAACKDELVGGNNYFLAFVPLSELVSTLKEFSIFKKWQQTAMALVFVFDTDTNCAKAALLLKGYKFKESIFVVNKSNFKSVWLAAAYCALWSDVKFDAGFVIKEAIYYDIPLLFNAKIGLPESWLKAGESFDFSIKLALSNHFKLYYKDEVYRQARCNMGHAWLNQQNTNGELQFDKKLPMCLK